MPHYYSVANYATIEGEGDPMCPPKMTLCPTFEEARAKALAALNYWRASVSMDEEGLEPWVGLLTVHEDGSFAFSEFNFENDELAAFEDEDEDDDDD